MQHFRRSLLNFLVLAVVAVALVGSPLATHASPVSSGSEPATPMLAPPSSQPDPNTGEPDSGSTRSQQVQPIAHPSHQSEQAQFVLRALGMLRWTSVLWAKRVLGVGN